MTDVFQLKGHTSDLELTTTADVNNNWIYLNYALINQDTGQAYDFGREVSYYHGYDSDGSWTEGSHTDRVAIPSVPPGNYYLRVEPESDFGHGTISYSISAKRDVPQASFLRPRAPGVVAARRPYHLALHEFRTFAMGRKRLRIHRFGR